MEPFKSHNDRLAESLYEGKVVYISKTERTDEFRHKRYSTIYKGRTVMLRCVVESVKGHEFKAKLEGNGSFEREGETYVFSVGDLLSDQKYRAPEELGKWREWDMSG